MSYANGGYVSGPGPASDTVPALLSRGCAVIPLAAMQRLGAERLAAMFPNSDVVSAEEVLAEMGDDES